jgi:hypothetical protein
MQVVAIVRRSGISIRTQTIADQIVLPEHVVLNDLLTELVEEKRLSRSYTLLVNGDSDCTYNLRT